ncbi:hypothetical protein Gotur_020259, partial [Gossypium turneri]
RLWQDAENRKLLANPLKRNIEQVSFCDVFIRTWKPNKFSLFDPISSVSIVAKSQGYLKHQLPQSESSSQRKLLAVIGVYIGFGSYLKRNTFRGSWMPRGDTLKKLKERGVVVQFVIGRSANRGDSLDRHIDKENSKTKDFFILDSKTSSEGFFNWQDIGLDSSLNLGLFFWLETTATFDPQTDEFVIHSPTLTSRKVISTHAVVYARLRTDGQDYGVHGFIVQLRSLDDHSPLPSMTVGDIGMKFGSGAYNSMDNGLLRFDYVRIPRNQMLMHLSLVTKEGKYVQSNVPRQLVYGTMVYVRQIIISEASCALSRAICISTRYSVVRRQFGRE